MNNQCTQVYTVNKPRLSSKNEKIFLTRLTVQFIDLEMLYISVKQGINFDIFSIFWIRMSRRFLQKLLQYRTTEYQLYRDRTRSQTFDSPERWTLKRPCMQISGNWHVPLSFKWSYPFEDYRSLTKDVDVALGTLLYLFWSTFY